MEKQDIIPYEQENNLLKLNNLIDSKYRGSLLESKVLYATLQAVQNKQMEVVDNGYRVSLKAGELKRITKSNSGSFYKSLRPVAQSLMNRSYGIESPDDDYFKYVHLISECEYDNGEFSVTFSRNSKNLIMNLSKNYTSLPRENMMSFKSVYSFRMYEILKRHSYYKKSVPIQERSNVFQFQIGLSELKLQVGTVNAELDTVRKVLNNSEYPDYDKAVKVSPEEIYPSFAEFNRNVLKVAQKEICEKTDDMTFTYEPLKGGRSHSVYAIEFIVDLNKKGTEVEPKERKKEISDDDIFEIEMKTMQLLSSYGCKIADVRQVCKQSGYDFERIKKAVEVLEQSNSEIESVVGFLISAIKNDYHTIKKSKTHDFDERKDNDWESVELALLKK